MIAVLGPTAAGKSAVAIELARRLDAEVISVDSMQVYRGMDVGTAKPTALERSEIRHHMVDVVDPEVDFSVSEFQQLGRQVLAGERRLVISGGSGLHFRALVDPMTFAPTDPGLRAELEGLPLRSLVGELESADHEAGLFVDLHNKRRVVRAVEIFRLGAGTPTERSTSDEADRLRRYEAEFHFDAVGIDPGERLASLVESRLHRMRAGGLVDEVKALASRLGRTARSAVGYREILGALDGRVNLDQAFADISRNTRKLARRQRTWFQRDPRIRWIPWSSDSRELADRAQEVLL